MKEIDDTEFPKSGSERPEWFERWIIETQMIVIRNLQSQVNRLKTQVANLEARKPPQDSNPDPEWFA